MRKMTILVLLAILTVMASCKNESSPDPASQTGKIMGAVANAGTGAGISGASVTTNPVTSTVTTDSQGAYTIPSVKAGSYAVTATAGSYTSNTVNVTVTAGQTATGNIALTPLVDYTGTWKGTTSQGRSITIKVSGSTITYLSFVAEVTGSGGTAIFVPMITYSPARTFSGNTFTLSGSTSFGPPTTDMTYTFNGTFTSSTAANGTMAITCTGRYPGTINGTWTATKE